ncbi:MAG: GNAT family N-acetyltransferase [Rhizobiaceae bacterium]
METLTTKRLVLKAPTLADVPEITRKIGNWNVARMLARVPHPYVPEDCAPWIAHITERNAAGLDMAYAIHRQGLIGVMSVEAFDGVPVFGYWLAETAWGQGYATEAGVAVLRHAFQTQSASEIKSSVFHDNEPSLKVQKKLGFEVASIGTTYSVSRKADVPSIKTTLSRQAFDNAVNARCATDPTSI